ncbi:hypothetical protein [Merismopedia glauca]|uniref:Oligosaccharide repeat unit polymerase n=1 Tax=Merismopedia glauca CCAP 1448/3 TaxID=1296344 RepID=A0A2T1C9C3_9CYAN|nr:hypothetical protein [Merismopedia glauca]PSB04856.1 hypothetical protein C7B64_01845 [Merismopedia glauca CCAP 1448/3]
MVAAIYLLLIFFILFLELTRRKSAIIDFLTLFNLGYLMWYVFPAILIALEPNKALLGVWLNASQYTNKPQTALALFAAYIFIFLGFHAKSAQTLAQKIKIESRNSQLIFLFTVGLLSFCLLCLYIYSSAFGGIIKAISQAIAVRSNTADGSTGEATIMLRFIGGTAFASYLFAGYVFTDVRKQDKFIQVILFIISVIGAICSFLVRAGRLDVIFYLLGFYQIVVQKTKKIPLVFSLLFVFFTVMFLFYGKEFFGALGSIPDGWDAVERSFTERLAEGEKGDAGFDIYSFMANFYYPIISLDVAFGKDYELRWFSDLYYGFISIIPDRLLGSEPPKTILYYNTVYISGAFDFAIPTGLLAFAVYSLWWPGLIVTCWVYGWIGGYLQTVFNRHREDVFWMPFFYSIVSQNWVVLQSSDPESYFQSNFIFLVSSLALLTLGAKIYLVPNSRTKGHS